MRLARASAIIGIALEGGDPDIVHSRIVSGGGKADVRIEWSVEQLSLRLKAEC